MYRESLAEKTGMLFLFPYDDDSHKFWMKNTLIPLDIIWLDASGRVLFVSANTPPCRADPCPNYGPDFAIASVLEIAGGMAEKEKVTVGSTIRLMDIPDKGTDLFNDSTDSTAPHAGLNKSVPYGSKRKSPSPAVPT